MLQMLEKVLIFVLNVLKEFRNLLTEYLVILILKQECLECSHSISLFFLSFGSQLLLHVASHTAPKQHQQSLFSSPFTNLNQIHTLPLSNHISLPKSHKIKKFTTLTNPNPFLKIRNPKSANFCSPMPIISIHRQVFLTLPVSSTLNLIKPSSHPWF